MPSLVVGPAHRSGGLMTASPDLRAMTFGAATSDRIVIPASSQLDSLGKVTLFALIRTRTFTSGRNILEKAVSATAGWHLRLATTNGIQLRWWRPTTNCSYGFDNTIAVGVWQWVIAAGDRSLGAGLKWKLYTGPIDSLARERTRTATTEGSGVAGSDAAAQMRIGNSPTGTDTIAFQGDIALAAVYGENLTIGHIHRFQREPLGQMLGGARCLGLWRPGHFGLTVPDESAYRGGPGVVTGAVPNSGAVRGFWSSLATEGGRAPTATTFPVTLAGGITPAGGLVRQTTKVLAGGLTPAGALVRQTTKLLAGGLTPAGALSTLKVVIKSLGGGLTPAGGLIRQTTKLLAGGLTPAAALVRQVTKVLAGGLTPAGALIRQTTKLLAGGLTPSGALSTLKVVIKSLGGGLTPAGGLVRQTTKLLAGGLTPAAALIRQTTKRLAGGLAPAGALIRQMTKRLGAAITPVGAFIGTLISAGAVVVMRLVAGVTVIPWGAAAIQARRALEGTVGARPWGVAGAAVKGALSAGQRILARLLGSTDIGPEA